MDVEKKYVDIGLDKYIIFSFGEILTNALNLTKLPAYTWSYQIKYAIVYMMLICMTHHYCHIS